MSVSNKIFQWCKLILFTGGMQFAIQIVAFFSGILIVRSLDINDYAYYSLATAFLGIMTVLSDGGISNSLMAIGGEVWSDKQKFGLVFKVCFNLRKLFSIVSLFISLPILFILLVHNNASLLTSGLICLSIIPVFYALLTSSLYEIPVKIHQNVLKMQQLQIGMNAGRLILTITAVLTIPYAFIILLITSIPQIWYNLKLKILSNNFYIITDNKEEEARIKKRVFSVVKKTLPGAIYFVLSGQITTLLISIYGNSESIAQIGALGRISMLLTLFNSIFTIIIVPRFARLPISKNVLVKKYLTIIILTIIGIVLFCYIISLIPEYVLLILGNSYMTLENELVLVIISSSINLLTGFIYNLNMSRTWIINPLILVIYNVSILIALVNMFDVGNLTQILYMNIVASLTQVLLFFIIGIREINKI